MRLLLAEDEIMLREALKALLEHERYAVDAVDNGEDALLYLENGEYDGAVLDIMMPKLDGLSVVRRLREEKNTVPVLLLTAKSEIDDRVTGLDSGADDYLTKPFFSKELSARIRAMLRRQPTLRDTALKVGNLTLNRADFTLSSPHGSVPLQNKEFQMIEMLMANPGQVISTERFLEKIWGLDTDAEANVVWVNLSGLRKKLETLGADVRIRAARGLGYSLEEVRDD